MRVWNDDAIYNTPNLTIHCQTEEEAEKLLCHLDKLGIKWLDGETPLYHTRFGMYNDKTCYCIDEYRCLEYCFLDYFRNPRVYVAEDTTDYNIVEFNEVFCDEVADVEPTELLDFIRGFQNDNNSVL